MQSIPIEPTDGKYINFGVNIYRQTERPYFIRKKENDRSANKICYRMEFLHVKHILPKSVFFYWTVDHAKRSVTFLCFDTDWDRFSLLINNSIYLCINFHCTQNWTHPFNKWTNPNLLLNTIAFCGDN